MKKLSLVLGGARSGKSAFAEQLTGASGLSKYYIATAQALDDEMTERIAAHRAERENWTTIEAPLDLVSAVRSVPDGGIILIDCLTLWLSNHMLNDHEADIDELLDEISKISNQVICVSNELGMGLVPDNALGRKFRDAQGIVNRKVAARADLAVFVAAGLPLVLKGKL